MRIWRLSSLILSFGFVLWATTAQANCGTPECTVNDVPEMADAIAAWHDLERTMEGQRKLAIWHDNQPNPALDHARALENNHAAFETYILASCGDLATDAQEPCYIEKIRERIKALEAPADDNYIWLK